MIKQMEEQELLLEFQKLATEHQRASEEGDYEVANRCIDNIGEVIRQLWRVNGANKKALRGLADLAKSNNPAAALMAVTYTEELYPEVAGELNRLKKDKSIIGALAQYALQNWKSRNRNLLKDTLKL